MLLCIYIVTTSVDINSFIYLWPHIPSSWRNYNIFYYAGLLVIYSSVFVWKYPYFVFIFGKYFLLGKEFWVNSFLFFNWSLSTLKCHSIVLWHTWLLGSTCFSLDFNLFGCSKTSVLSWVHRRLCFGWKQASGILIWT